MNASARFIRLAIHDIFTTPASGKQSNCASCSMSIPLLLRSSQHSFETLYLRDVIASMHDFNAINSDPSFQKRIAIGSDKQSCYECDNSMIRLTYKEVLVYDSVDNLMITRGILKRSEIILRRFRCFRCPSSQIDGLHANLDR